jgi:hypothetical protein
MVGREIAQRFRRSIHPSARKVWRVHKYSISIKAYL